MKSYTDLEQSKKLAEILSVESADMRYHTVSHYSPYPCDEIVYTVEFGRASGKDIPCWSLAALISILPCGCLTIHVRKKYRVIYNPNTITEGDYDNPVDACVEMIIKLNELKIL